MSYYRKIKRPALAGLAFAAIASATSCGEIGTTEAAIKENAISAILVSPETTTVMAGEARHIEARVLDGRGNVVQGAAVRWESSDTTVARVSATGNVQFMKEGEVQVGASAGGLTSYSRFWITRMSVRSVRISPSSLDLGVGAEQTVVAQTVGFFGDILTGRTVVWSSSDARIATVDSTGKVRGESAGYAEIVATSEGRSGRIPIRVADAAPAPIVASVTVNPGSASVMVEETLSFSATLKDAAGTTIAGGSISWVSSDTTIATVSSAGLASPRKAGSAMIRAISGSVSGQSTLTVRAATLQSLSITPSTASVIAGGSQQFIVAGTWSDGGTHSPAVLYAASGGTIASDGRFTADATVGTYRVIAVQQAGTLADTAVVTVTAAAPVLQAVVLTPIGASLIVGTTRQFSVSGQWSNGATTAPAVTYSATGGTISGGGLYTAGGTAGTYRVIAVQQGGTLADTAAVTVTSAPASGPNLNEPTGYVRIADQPFNSLTADGWRIESSNPTLTTDATAPISPSGIVRATYSAGFGSGSAPWAVERALSTRPTSLYYRFAVKHSANFQGQGSATNKLGFVWIDGGPDFFVSAEGTGSGNLVVTARIQGTGDSREYLRPNQGPSGVIARGSWHTVEVELISNTPGVSNGTVRVWLDNVRIIEYTDVRFSGAGETNYWEVISLYPIWGGGTGQSVSSTMTIDFDHIYVSGK